MSAHQPTPPSLPVSPRGHQAQQRGQSPLRFLFSLIIRVRKVDGPSLETDLALEAIQEERQGLAACAGASTKVETALDRYCRLFQEAAADSVLNDAEKAALARAMLSLKRTAHTTTRYIGALR